MHRSRVQCVILDVPEPELASARDFWAAALGASPAPVPHEPQFTSLIGASSRLAVALQSVDDAPRMHFDIDTDDVDAEVGRLVALGAIEVSQWLDCHVLRAPGGHLLCVVPVAGDHEEFKAQARVWP